MKENKNIFIQAFLWLFIFMIFGVLDRSHYLGGWIYHNKNFYIILAVIAIIITIFNKNIGYFMTLGNICGLICGRFIGDYIKYKNILKITAQTSVEEEYFLRSHKGFFIWILCIIISILIACLIEIIKKIINRFKNLKDDETIND